MPYHAALDSERLDVRGRSIAHLCVDMQKMFAEESEWRTPWMKRVLPKALAIAERYPQETVFSRFIPPRNADDASGSWRAYFERWPSFTLDRIEPHLLDLVEPLAAVAAHATVLDKPGFSPFHETALHSMLKARGVDTLVITGGETDICVLAAVLNAVDLGYFVLLPKDALCSSADETHDALMTLYASRFSQQICLSDTETILAAWDRSAVTRDAPSTAGRRATP